MYGASYIFIYDASAPSVPASSQAPFLRPWQELYQDPLYVYPLMVDDLPEFHASRRWAPGEPLSDPIPFIPILLDDPLESEFSRFFVKPGGSFPEDALTFVFPFLIDDDQPFHSSAVVVVVQPGAPALEDSLPFVLPCLIDDPLETETFRFFVKPGGEFVEDAPSLVVPPLIDPLDYWSPGKAQVSQGEFPQEEALSFVWPALPADLEGGYEASPPPVAPYAAEWMEDHLALVFLPLPDDSELRAVPAEPITWTDWGPLVLFEKYNHPYNQTFTYFFCGRRTVGTAIYSRVMDATLAAEVAGSTVSATSPTIDLVESAEFLLVDQHEYRMQTGKGSGDDGEWWSGRMKPVRA